MKKTLIIINALIINALALAQNVGIGTLSPVRGRLVVDGVAGTGATTAIFGNMEAGISLQQNYPTIGFNQYRDLTSPGSYGRYMKTGYAALISISQDNGTIYIDNYGYGTGGSFTGNGIIGWAVKPTGNMAVGHGNAGAMLDVVRGANSYAPDGTAAFRGSTFNSHFNQSVPEHTLIRGGKAGSHVYINDVNTLGNIYMGGGAAVLAINTVATDGAGTLVIEQIGEQGIGLINSEFGNLRWEINNEIYTIAPDALSTSLTLRYNGRANTQMGWFRPTDGGYSNLSDGRLKENITPLQPVLKNLMLLKPSNYRFINHNASNPMQMGFIAQEVKALFPELVDVRHLSATDTSPIKDLHGMNYSGLAVIAVKAIQEQQTQIEKLTNKVQQLALLLAELKAVKN